jgi:cell fate regulator YaaT (PSP1 superfamily)
VHQLLGLPNSRFMCISNLHDFRVLQDKRARDHAECPATHKMSGDGRRFYSSEMNRGS